MVIKKSILNRLYVVVVLMTLFLLFIIFRVIKLQYFDGDKYRKLSLEKTVKNDTIFANRGNVYAADGNLLATSITKYTIRMDAVVVKSAVFEKNIRALSDSLSQMLGKPARYYQDKIRRARKRKNRYLLIARNVGYNNCAKMRTFPIFNEGIYRGGFIAEQSTVRVHPIGKIAARTIGYDNKKGGAGIEGAFADYMQGENGWRLKQKIAKGQWKPINDVNEKEPVDGSDVITTIDVNIQDITHHALLRQLNYFEADHGCAVVMEVETGEIKAISNLGRTSEGKYYEKRNYAVWESHEPGSTFKLASLMAVLEDRVADTSDVVDCGNGRIFINNRKVEDSKNGGHGKISLARIFEVSSNVGIVKTIRKNYDKNPQKFIKRIESFGLDKLTDVKIKGEGKPYIPNPSEKSWSPISLEWMAWGYGVHLTALQTLTFYNAVANNGKLVKPYFVKELRMGGKVEKRFETVVLKEKIASQNTINKVRKVMENVVKKGTAESMYSSRFSMAGKTGTAKKWIPKHKNKSGKTVYGHYSNKKYVASFVGFFPADKPKYSCIVVVHSPDKDKGYYGAKVAAPVFKDIAQKIYTTTPINNQLVSDEISSESIDKEYQDYYNKLIKYKTIMPKVIGMSAMDAIALLENMGLHVEFSGMGKVTEQSIDNGVKVSKGATVYLKLL
ncbi:penicillin-binding protein [Tenacibaculum finnmarkense]|uniref:penicillin-binding protein n=1 Tax=Tenacibaculum finnmarkense TaxID=2781243 RepID=UPI001E43A43C|nr:penicillin-binding protein [Tenacibaculum finnmarkense]MCD8403156.1 transpeptidase family protein [Tenacibaculum finnmarkense genomovar finnmarkense]MCD8416603.1 transpeptidase family protein [Tenacibaculum finnmarkense genomovar finnmarkense]MCD8428095.1 transpeptidase family protein [Tenacibaculum finnmarkense genomovar finnmarkense]MCD8454473.1 transpeptidase family protein [Tenacibaculum finnmarkense genomovar ulcerans]